MNTNIWKKIKFIIYYFIGFFAFRYIFDNLLYKFGFEQTTPKIQHILYSSILFSVTFGLFFKKNEIKKIDIYILLIIIVFAIGVYFLIHNW